jgi:hypothetical protein
MKVNDDPLSVNLLVHLALPSFRRVGHPVQQLGRERPIVPGPRNVARHDGYRDVLGATKVPDPGSYSPNLVNQWQFYNRGSAQTPAAVPGLKVGSNPTLRRGDDDPCQSPHLRYKSISDHTAISLPLGSAKWNRRPPGNEKIFLTIFPPAASILFMAAARSPA